MSYLEDEGYLVEKMYRVEDQVTDLTLLKWASWNSPGRGNLKKTVLTLRVADDGRTQIWTASNEEVTLEILSHFLQKCLMLCPPNLLK